MHLNNNTHNNHNSRNNYKPTSNLYYLGTYVRRAQGELLAVEHDPTLSSEENEQMVNKAQAVAQGGTAILAAQGREVRSHKLMPGDMWGEINLLQVGRLRLDSYLQISL